MHMLYKSVSCMIALLLFVMTLLFMLSSFKFQAVLADLIADRLGTASPAIYEPIESAVGLGLGLGEIQNTESVIAWLRQNDPGIQAIDVFDINGESLYASGEETAGRVDAAYVLEMLETTEAHSVQVEQDTGFLSAFKLLGKYGQMVGGGLILFSKADYNRRVASFKNSIFLKSLMIFMASSILGSIGIALALRGLRRYLKSIEMTHDKIKSSEVRGGERLLYRHGWAAGRRI